MATKKIVMWRGQPFDPDTAAALEEVDRLVGPSIPVRPAQGSYENGSLSAGTHSGGGAVDLSCRFADGRMMSRAQILTLVRTLRLCGFAAWWRTSPEWTQGDHIHAIRVDCTDLNPIAANQVAALRKGFNGLGHLGLGGKDRHVDMKLPVIGWNTYLKRKAKDEAATKKKALAAAVAAAALAASLTAATTGPSSSPAPAPAKPAATATAAPSPKPVTVKSVVKVTVVKATKLNVMVKPGARVSQVRDIKKVMTKLGYGRGMDLASTLYGTGLEAAVSRFHKAHPEFGKATDTELGPKGWAFLQKKAGRV